MREQKPPFDPKDLIDRTAEQELFHNLVAFTSPARLLIIKAEGGWGRSSLLKRLVYNCRRVINPTIPACLIELDHLHDPNPYQFVTQIVEELKIPDQFAKFQELETARLSRNHKVFGLDPQIRALLQSNVKIEGSVEQDAEVIATKINKIKNLTVLNPEWTPDHEKLARQKCIEAFFEDLRAICAVQPIALLLDGWEGCNIEFRNRWIVEELLENHCFHPNKNLRPDKLIIVVAGRPHDPPKERQGLRDDEFLELFNNNQEYLETVSSLKSLSLWEKDHVKDFLVINGRKNPTEKEIDYIQERLGEGWSLEKLLQFIEFTKQ